MLVLVTGEPRTGQGSSGPQQLGDSLGLCVLRLAVQPFADGVGILEDPGIKPCQSGLCLGRVVLGHLDAWQAVEG